MCVFQPIWGNLRLLFLQIFFSPVPLPCTSEISIMFVSVLDGVPQFSEALSPFLLSFFSIFQIG